MSTPSAEKPDATQPARPLVRRASRWRSILLCVVIFISGFVIGAGGALGIAWRAYMKTYQQPEQVSQRLYSRMNQFLDLAPEQQEPVREIVEARLERIFELRSEMQPLLRDELHSMRDEVADVLTDEQRTVWVNRFQVVEKLWLPESNESEPPAQNRD